jgi:predicted nuclease with TOPRIM domain
MINNTLILFALKEAIADRHPTELAGLLENTQEEFKAAIELEKDPMTHDMLSIELEVITDLLHEEITRGFDREHTRCIEYMEHVASEHRSAMLDGVYDKELQESDQLVEELFQKVQRA